MSNTKELREKITIKGLDVVADTDILELLDHLETAESDALEQARLNGIGAERELALMAKLEAAEQDRATFIMEIGNLCTKVEALLEELSKQQSLSQAAQQLAEVAQRRADALRAKIEQMEEQEQEPSAPEFCPCCGNIMRACMICPNEDCNAVTATAEQSKYNKQHALARKASGAAAPEAKP